MFQSPLDHHAEMVSYSTTLDASSWKYEHRRTMQEIIEGLYLSSYGPAKNYDMLKANGITHIVCVRAPYEATHVKPKFPNDFAYTVIEIADRPDVSIIPYFESLNKEIFRVLSAGGRVLVHGLGGISRSASLVIAYVMQARGMDMSAAYQLVQARRFCISPNEGFKSQLAAFGAICLARIQSQNFGHATPRGFKRPADDTPFDGFDEFGGVTNPMHEYLPSAKQFYDEAELDTDAVMM